MTCGILDNIMWNCLSGPHRKYSAGTDRILRYSRGFSPIVGFPDPLRPDLDQLLPFCEAGEQFYCEGWTGEPPPAWTVVAESTMLKMVWDGPAPGADPAPDAVALGLQHADQALELAALTRPGPFGPRTVELGDCFGLFEQGQLIAMAGERMCAPSFREVSGICTRPGFQRAGRARRLTLKLVARQLGRGERPFLHVMRDNVAARKLYRQLGFRDYRESVVRVVAPR